MGSASPRERAAAEPLHLSPVFTGFNEIHLASWGLAPKALCLRLLSQSKISGLVADTVRISDFHFLCKSENSPFVALVPSLTFGRVIMDFSSTL